MRACLNPLFPSFRSQPAAGELKSRFFERLWANARHRAAKRECLHGACVRVRRGTAARCLWAWAGVLAELQTEKARQLHSRMSLWRAAAACEARRRQAALRAVRVRREGRTARATLAGWAAWTSQRVRRRLKLVHALALRERQLLLRCTGAWALRAARSQSLTGLLQDAAQRRRGALLARCTAAWARVAAEAQEEMLALRQAAVGRAAAVLSAWRARCALFRRVRAALRRRQRAALASAMTAWGAWAAAKRSRRHLCARAQAARELRLLRAALALWRAAARARAANRLASAAVQAAVSSSRAQAALRGWRAAVAASSSLRHAALRAWVVSSRARRRERAAAGALEAANARAEAELDSLAARMLAERDAQLAQLQARADAALLDAADRHHAQATQLLDRAQGEREEAVARALDGAAEALADRTAALFRRRRATAALAGWRQLSARTAHCERILSARVKAAKQRLLRAVLDAWLQAGAVQQCLALLTRRADAHAARSLLHRSLTAWRGQVPLRRRAEAAAADMAVRLMRRRQDDTTLRFAWAAWLRAAAMQQRDALLMLRAAAHARRARLRGTMLAWTACAAAHRRLLVAVAARARGQAERVRRAAFSSWQLLATETRALCAEQRADAAVAELTRLKSRHARLVAAAMDGPTAPSWQQTSRYGPPCVAARVDAVAACL